MKYKKFDCGNYNLHIVNTNRFKKIKVIVNFKRELKREEVTIRNFLTDILVTSSKKYPTNRDVIIETENLYNANVSATAIKSGKYNINSFSTSFLNEKYTEIGMNEKSIQFLMELIYNPNINKKEFDSNSFDIVKRGLEDDINSTKDNPSRYSVLKMYDLIAPNSKISYHPTGYIEDLEKITRENLYNYYKELIEHSILDIFVIGEIDEKEAKAIINKYVIEPIEKITSGNHILTHTIYNDETVTKESMNIKQSRLVIGLKIEELTDFERQYVMNIYSSILGSGGESKLFKTVREQNSLCYDISCSYNPLYHILVITSGIDKKNYDKTILLIKQELENMTKGDFTDEQVKKGITTYINACKELEDSPTLLANAYLSHEYLNNDLIEEKEEKIKKVNKKMVISLAKKVHLDTIFLLEGDEKHASNAS